jgi:hypothetical protein
MIPRSPLATARALAACATPNRAIACALATLTLLVALAVAGSTPAHAVGVCDVSATPSTFGSAVSQASTGQTICLASGNYGTWSGVRKAVTITAAPGASPQMAISFGSGASGFTLSGMGDLSGQITSGASNITLQDNTMSDVACWAGCLDIEGSVSNIIVDHNDFTYPVQSGSSGPNSKIFLDTSGSSPGSAVTIENNDIENGDLDGIHFGGGSGDLITGNTFRNLCDLNVNHTDNIQFEGGTQITIQGNYIYTPGPNSSSNCVAGGIASYDGNTNGLLIEDNVVDVTRDWGIELYSDQSSIVVHNTVVWHSKAYSAFNSGDGQIDIDRKSQDPAGSGTHVYDNIGNVDFTNGSKGTADHNVSGQNAAYVGPLNVYVGFQLSPTSPVGLGAASDGLSDGARISLPGGAAPPPPASPTPNGHPGLTAPAPVTQGAAPPGSALVASFGFGRISGSRVSDSSGHRNDGTIHGASWTRHGKHGGALVFDGVHDYVSVPGSRSLDLTRGMTLEAWVRPSRAGGGWRAVIVKRQRHGRAYGLYAQTARGRAAGWVRLGRRDYGLQGGRNLPPGRWSYLTITYDGSTLRIYVDGVLESARGVRGAVSSGRGPLLIGGGGPWARALGGSFKGTIDDVRVWRTALSAAQIRAEMRVDASR